MSLHCSAILRLLTTDTFVHTVVTPVSSLLFRPKWCFNAAPFRRMSLSCVVTTVRERVDLSSEASLVSSLEKVSKRLQYLAIPHASLAVPSAVRAKGSLDARELSLLTSRGVVVNMSTRSTFNGENLGELADLRERMALGSMRTYTRSLRDSVQARSPLQTTSKDHERMTPSKALCRRPRRFEIQTCKERFSPSYSQSALCQSQARQQAVAVTDRLLPSTAWDSKRVCSASGW